MLAGPYRSDELGRNACQSRRHVDVVHTEIRHQPEDLIHLREIFNQLIRTACAAAAANSLIHRYPGSQKKAAGLHSGF
jgi:hypothetical protein